MGGGGEFGLSKALDSRLLFLTGMNESHRAHFYNLVLECIYQSKVPEELNHVLGSAKLT